MRHRLYKAGKRAAVVERSLEEFHADDAKHEEDEGAEGDDVAQPAVRVLCSWIV